MLHEDYKMCSHCCPATVAELPAQQNTSLMGHRGDFGSTRSARAPRLAPQRQWTWLAFGMVIACLDVVRTGDLVAQSSTVGAPPSNKAIQPSTSLVPVELATGSSVTRSSPVQELEAAAARTDDAVGDNPVLVDQIPKSLDEIRLLEDTVNKIADQVRSATVSVAGGSGVIVSADGLILSCAHVGGAAGRRVRVTMADGKRVTAVTLGNNHKVDAGMMKITEEGTWPFVPISDETIRPGRWCFAIGYPVTYEPGQEAPVRLGRVLRVASDAITSDCTIMGGDSGGPLFDLQGKLIGINSRVSNSLTGNIHVPMPAFKLDWEQMVAGKDITFPAYLGVNRVEGATDAKVGSVVADSAADRAGIKPGDVIVSFNRIPIKNFDELREAVAQCNPEQSVRIKLIRGAEEIYVRARLGELPRNEP